MLTEQEKKQEWQAHTVSTKGIELENLISNAIKKVGGSKENDLCRYLPMVTGGYMHHFTLRKMKHQVPERLSEMIKKFIIDADKPLTVKPKQRAARGSRKKKGQVVLVEADIERMLQLARAAGDRDMVRKLTPRKELKALKRELIASIRNNTVSQTLWETYVEAVS
jgi:hypothetical protein